jgi:hypothetical protein
MQKSKITPTLCFVALLILSTPLCFSQKDKQYKTKRLITKPTNDSAKRHPFYNAMVYFSGNGLSQVKVATFYGTDLPGLMKMIDSESNGAIVTFDYLKCINDRGEVRLITEIPYNFTKSKDTAKYESNALKEVKKLMSLDFVSGTIYFSGANFANTISTTPKGINSLKPYYDRCGPGSIITLDNCIYKNADGTISNSIIKSIKL